jgi:hypothetical protein
VAAGSDIIITTIFRECLGRYEAWPVVRLPA